MLGYLSIENTHQIYYSNENQIPITEVAESLLAYNRIAQLSPRVFHKLMPNIEISQLDVIVGNIETGSLFEEFIVKFLFRDQQGFDDAIEKLRGDVGMDSLKENKTLFAVVIAALVGAGIMYLINNNKTSTTSQEKATIQANNNVIINYGAGMVGLSEGEFQAVVENVVKTKSEKVRLANDAATLLKPAKSDPNAEVTLDGSEKLKFDKKVIAVIPNEKLVEPEDEEDSKEFYDVDIYLRATDLDNPNRGWGVIVPEVSDLRVKMHVDPGINLSNLGGKTKIVGDISVMYKRKEGEPFRPYLYYLKDIASNHHQNGNLVKSN